MDKITKSVIANAFADMERLAGESILSGYNRPLRIKGLLDNLHKEILDKSSKSRAVKRGHLLIRKDILLQVFSDIENENKALDLAINNQSIRALECAQSHWDEVINWERTMFHLLQEDAVKPVANKIQEMKDAMEQQKRHIARLESVLLKTLKNLEA